MAGGTMRIGADVGGTFTDVVLETGSGMFSTKVLTTYDAPERESGRASCRERV